MIVAPATAEPAGPLIRRWRQRRRLSQLELSELARTSTRHLSCVETGIHPSQDKVLRLAGALEVSVRETNRMHLGAGLRADLS